MTRPLLASQEFGVKSRMNSDSRSIQAHIILHWKPRMSVSHNFNRCNLCHPAESSNLVQFETKEESAQCVALLVNAMKEMSPVSEMCFSLGKVWLSCYIMTSVNTIFGMAPK